MEYRIVVVGDGAVGKSALTVRFTNGTFMAKYEPTIEDSYRKQVEVDGKACILDILDTAGQEEYSALRDQYMKTGDGFVLVYSVTSLNSFESAHRLKTSVYRVKDELEEIPIVLVGNKCDLDTERVVSTEEGRKLSELWNVGFVETSAKTNKNINTAFFELVRMINKWREKYPNNAPDNVKRQANKRFPFSFCSLL